jgi:hypothetical protein
MIDWNITRKLAFCYDFIHVPLVTGEYFAPFEVTDRISHLQITNKEGFKQVLRKVKADMPAAPWPYVSSVEAILPVGRWDRKLKNTITRMIDDISYPLTILLIDNGMDQGNRWAASSDGIGALKNIRIIDLPENRSFTDACRIGAQLSSADYIILGSPELDVGLLTAGFYQILESLRSDRCDLVPLSRGSSNGGPPHAFLRRECLLQDDFPNQVRVGRLGSLEAPEIPPGLKPDYALSQARELTASGEYDQALEMIRLAVSFERGAPKRSSQMDQLFGLYLKLGQHQAAELELKELIGQGYRPDNFIRLGRLLETRGRYSEAIEAYQNGLEALGLYPDHFKSTIFPQRLPEECDAFTALMGLGECYHKTRRLTMAERMFWLARQVNLASPRPYLGYAAVLAESNRLEEAKTILAEAEVLKNGSFQVRKEN